MNTEPRFAIPPPPPIKPPVAARETNPEWFTPEEYIRAAEIVFGIDRFDLDPASTLEANRIVNAKRYLTRADGGLRSDWGDARTIWCNPPSGVIKDRELIKRWGTKSLPVAFWRKCSEHFDADQGRLIMFEGFNLEFLRTAQGSADDWFDPTDFAFCIPKQRIKHVPGAGQKKTSPANASVFVCVSSSLLVEDRFDETFDPKFGAVVAPK